MSDSGPNPEAAAHRVRRRAFEREIEDADSKRLPPEGRAEAVFSILALALGEEDEEHLFTGETWWDLVCFANWFLVNGATGLGDEQLLGIIRMLNNWIYSMHYEAGESFLPSNRKEREEHYLEIIERLKPTENIDELWEDFTTAIIDADAHSDGEDALIEAALKLKEARP